MAAWGVPGLDMHLVCGTWCVAPGVWHLICGTRCVHLLCGALPAGDLPRRTHFSERMGHSRKEVLHIDIPSPSPGSSLPLLPVREAVRAPEGEEPDGQEPVVITAGVPPPPLDGTLVMADMGPAKYSEPFMLVCVWGGVGLGRLGAEKVL